MLRLFPDLGIRKQEEEDKAPSRGSNTIKDTFQRVHFFSLNEKYVSESPEKFLDIYLEPIFKSQILKIRNLDIIPWTKAKEFNIMR